MAGGLFSSGFADIYTRLWPEATGGILAQGSATKIFKYNLEGTGGALTEGEIDLTTNFSPEGGLFSSGTATVVAIYYRVPNNSSEKFAYFEYPSGGAILALPLVHSHISVNGIEIGGTTGVSVNGKSDESVSVTRYVEDAEGGLIANGAVINNPTIQGGSILSGLSVQIVPEDHIGSVLLDGSALASVYDSTPELFSGSG